MDVELEQRPTRDVRGRWLKGCPSPNPGGSPRESVLAEISRQLELEGPDGRPARVRVVEKLISMALDGDVRAMALLLSRVAPEQLAIRHEGGRDGDDLVVYVRDFTGANGRAPGQLVNPPPGQLLEAGGASGKRADPPPSRALDRGSEGLLRGAPDAEAASASVSEDGSGLPAGVELLPGGRARWRL